VPGHAARRSAWRCAAFSKTIVNLRQIEFGEFGSSSVKNTTVGSNRLSSDF
jgi:hypothetical protein